LGLFSQYTPNRYTGTPENMMARPMPHATGSEDREKISRNAQKIRKITGHGSPVE